MNHRVVTRWVIDGWGVVGESTESPALYKVFGTLSFRDYVKDKNQ